MVRGWFVTGTDTGVGKTRVSCALLAACVRRGRRVVGMKPVASGCFATAHGLRSEDAEALLAAGNVPAAYADVNPYCFAPATAPHLAAVAAGVVIETGRVRDHFARLAAAAEVVVVEGIGGWQVPLGPALDMSEVVRDLALPVILVVGVRLGCLNHALLTRAAIDARGLRLAGWVANHILPESPPGYVEALRERLPAPLLAELAHGIAPADAATRIDLDALGL